MQELLPVRGREGVFKTVTGANLSGIYGDGFAVLNVQQIMGPSMVVVTYTIVQVDGTIYQGPR